jgi:hypothetical protein
MLTSEHVDAASVSGPADTETQTLLLPLLDEQVSSQMAFAARSRDLQFKFIILQYGSDVQQQ